MADTQYDVSEKFKKLFEIKQKQRKANKEYYQKLIYNPHRPIEGGVPFDPVLFRFKTIQSYKIEHFRPNVKNVLGTLLAIYFPIYLTYKIISWERNTFNEKVSTGQIAYKDRHDIHIS